MIDNCLQKKWCLLSFTAFLFLLLPIAGRASEEANGRLVRVKGHVTVTRSGKEYASASEGQNAIGEDFDLKDRDAVETSLNARVVISSRGFYVVLGPQTLVLLDYLPQKDHTPVFSLVYGHIKVVVKRKAKGGNSSQVNPLKVRTPLFLSGFKLFPASGGGDGEYWVHSVRSSLEWNQQLAGTFDSRAPRVRSAPEMIVFEKLLTRIDAVAGAVSVRPREGEDWGEPVTVAMGSKFELLKGSPAKVLQCPLEEQSRIRKALDLGD